jgi:hypothetical protein
LFFIHLPKTGGLTVNYYVYRCLAGQAVYPAGPGAPFEHFQDIDQLRTKVSSAGPPPRFLTGHFPFYLSNDFGFPVVTATVLRDPVERTISQLRMIAAEEERFAGLTLEQIYEAGWNRPLLMGNMMTRLLSATKLDGLARFSDYIEIDASRLAVAKQNLQKIDVLGFQDRVEDFLARLTSRFAWSPRPVVSINVRGGEPQVTREFRRRIAHDCGYDTELYEFARGLDEP